MCFVFNLCCKTTVAYYGEAQEWCSYLGCLKHSPRIVFNLDHKIVLPVHHQRFYYLFIYLFIYLINYKLISERERHQCERETSIGCLLYAPDQGSNLHLDMCPDGESNSQLFGVWDNAPTNWSTQSEQWSLVFDHLCHIQAIMKMIDTK